MREKWRYKFSDAELAAAVAQSVCVADVIRTLGAGTGGSTHAYISGRIKSLDLDTSHFDPYARSRRTALSKRTRPEEVFVVTSRRIRSETLAKALLSIGVPYCCANCDVNGIWRGSPIVLDVDHINGDPLDNRKENLRFLCPNCHRQCPTRYSHRSEAAKARRREVRTCPKCQGPKRPKSIACKQCRTPSGRPSKIDWPSADVLRQMIQEHGYLGTGRLLGVTDNAVRKHLRKNGQ